MKAFFYLVIFLVSSSLFTPAFAKSNHGYAIHYIKGEGDVDGIKLAYQYHPENLLPTDWQDIEVYFESSINFWVYGKQNNHDQNFVIAVSPVFKYPMSEYRGRPIHFEVGIGIALLDDTQFAGKNVSTHYQFEDRIGVVYDLGDANVALKYMHYSNAGFKSPNPGLDFLSLSYSARF